MPGRKNWRGRGSLTPELFDRACALLWGARYKPAAAEALGVTVKSVQRWANGRQPVPPRIAGALGSLVAERQRDLDEMALALRTGIPPADV